MPYRLLLIALPLLLTAPPLPAQTPRPSAQARALTSPEARVAQYYQDYLTRLQAVYFAPGDPRATFLLSTATDELSARRKGLRAELAPVGKPAKPAATVPGPAWQQQLAELQKTPQAAKFLDRCRRNPALETAYQRFVDARLDELFPAAGPK